ncbi:hypothetical protein PYCCODRAFT_702296 [Trametes coccinea BRFM310]|uniref:Uncharacterized protein n=1 Tax=Trametes coccinea (strain BRFM310) TaxID=1353009 RepID=A0A1Y2IJH1_TRAC3|nr:hypothetical protein PYCCODRAFT_702296 [Trametes coccinea BRFM310]
MTYCRWTRYNPPPTRLQRGTGCQCITQLEALSEANIIIVSTSIACVSLSVREVINLQLIDMCQWRRLLIPACPRFDFAPMCWHRTHSLDLISVQCLVSNALDNIRKDHGSLEMISYAYLHRTSRTRWCDLPHGGHVLACVLWPRGWRLNATGDGRASGRAILRRPRVEDGRDVHFG